MPWIVYLDGQATGVVVVRTPALSRAVEVMTFIVEPGATSAVSAKSFWPSLLAMARIFPVDGWITTIELFLCMATAVRAADSACELIVVPRAEMLVGATTAAWLLATALPAAVWISTESPGLPCPGGACCISPAILASPGSPYVVRAFPLASVTETTMGGTATAARRVVAVRCGA